jgi:hypothetical protein
MSNIYWMFVTQWGMFSIIPRGEQFEVMFNEESLGFYPSPTAALEDLVCGYTSWPSNGLNPAEAGLPGELPEWIFVRR